MHKFDLLATNTSTHQAACALPIQTINTSTHQVKQLAHQNLRKQKDKKLPKD
jgi:hypothetical protein